MPLFLPEALPATVLLLVMPLGVVMASWERRAIDIPGLVCVLLGRLVGTFGGVGILWLIPDRYLSLLFGSLMEAGAIMSSTSNRVTLRNWARVVGGVASGVMGTAPRSAGRCLPSSTRAARGRRCVPPSR